MTAQEFVYTDTWYLATNDCFDERRRSAPDVAPLTSPFKCDFCGLALPILDYHVSKPDRTPVRIVVLDHPYFFHLLAESDRKFILQNFACTLLQMVKREYSRYQYGFEVDVLDEDLYGTLQYPHVEYHFTLIRSGFDDDSTQPRYIANIRSGLPPKKLRRCYDRLENLALRVQQRLQNKNRPTEDL